MKSFLISFTVTLVLVLIIFPASAYILFFSSINYILKIVLVAVLFVVLPYFFFDVDKFFHKTLGVEYPEKTKKK